MRALRSAIEVDLLWNGAFDAPLNDIFCVFPLPIVSFEGLNLPPMKLMSEAAKQNLKRLKLREGLTGIFQETVLTDEVMYEIAWSFPNLTAISLSGCCDLTDAAMAYLAVGCRHLKQIGLHDSEYISDDGLIRLFETYTDVEQIVIEGMDHVTIRALLKIADLFPNLHTLGLIGLLIPSRTIFNLILERKLRAKVILCDNAKWIEDKLMDKHFHPLPKFQHTYVVAR